MSSPGATLHSMTTNNDPYELLTRHEVAGLLRVHVATVNKLVRRGKLPIVKVGARTLITREALHGYIRGDLPDPLGADDTTLPPTPSIFNRVT